MVVVQVVLIEESRCMKGNPEALKLLSRVSSRSWLSGERGHLTAEESGDRDEDTEHKGKE